ncbi:unnamed protein product [Peniophora sp. CBMAI 1063]|nr:unnamed protein product [Peniophora sp. CBMAI 1063]
MSQPDPADVDKPSDAAPLLEAEEGVGLEHRLSGSTQWQSNMSVQDAAQHQTQFVKDMEGQFSNSVDPVEFMDKYFPLKEGDDPKPPRRVKFSENIINDEKAWATAVNKKKLCPSLKFFCTKDANSGSPSMDDEKRRPDIAAFPVMSKKEETALIASNYEELFARSPLIIERKRSLQDAFRDKLNEFIGVEKETAEAEFVRGQLITYAMNQHHQQPRTASYQVLLIEKNARIIRFDRAGAVCTTAFDWTDGTIFPEFLSRFHNADQATRGYDTTVEPADEADITAATDAFAKAGYGKTHGMRGPFYKYAVPVTRIDPSLLSPESGPSTASADEPDDTPVEMRYFIAGCPITWSRSFTGRATTGYVCYDLAENDVCFMKDAWRINDPSLLAEYQVYALLGRERPDLDEDARGPVPHVPRLLCGGDLRNPGGSLQETRTEVFKEGKKQTVQKYTHFRMVVKDIGKPLSSFKDIPELLHVLRDIVIAHQYAVKRGILHRDISVGNILIGRDAAGKAYGLLIDWDLCFVRDHAQTDEQRWITGTWQFMSIALLSRRKGHRHSEMDDLESVFWVLCYCLVRYTNLYNGSDRSAAGHLNTFYDLAHPGPSQRQDRPETMIGGETKVPLLTALDAGEEIAYLPAENMPEALYILLSGVAKSLSRYLQQRDMHQAVARFEGKTFKKGSYGATQLASAKQKADFADSLYNQWPKFSHESFLSFFTDAIQDLDGLEPSATVHGSMVVSDRLKAHQEVVRHREKAEQDRARSIRKQKLADARAAEKAAKAHASGAETRSGRKRGRAEDNTAPSGSKRRRAENTGSGSSYQLRSSRREPAGSPVPEGVEPEE